MKRQVGRAVNITKIGNTNSKQCCNQQLYKREIYIEKTILGLEATKKNNVIERE